MLLTPDAAAVSTRSASLASWCSFSLAVLDAVTSMRSASAMS